MAVTTVVYLLNRAPTKSVVSKTPYEAWFQWNPSVHYLRTFGCLAHVKPTKPHTNKLDDWSVPMVLLGYEKGSKAYRVYDPINKKGNVTRDVVFEEEKQWDWSLEVDMHSNSEIDMLIVKYSTHHNACINNDDGEKLQSTTPSAFGDIIGSIPSVSGTAAEMR